MNTPFKRCSSCDADWPTLESFLSDPKVVLAGYQVPFDDLEGGLFFFTHRDDECGTTLAISVKDFLPLNDLPLLAERDTKLCTGSEFCVRHGALSRHPVKCECAWVRDILQIIREWKKTPALNRNAARLLDR